MDYTFNDWLEGKPLPGPSYWARKKMQNGKADPVALEIIKAKKFAFDTALEYSLSTIKEHFLKNISGLSDSRKKMYIQKTIEDSEKHYKEFDVKKIIIQSHPNKFKGVDGRKYLKVKTTYDDLQNGKCFGSVIHLNDFFFAVLYFEFVEFLKGAKWETEQSEIITKNHSQKTRVDYEPKYRFYLLEKLGLIEPKGIFYDQNLSLNQRAELLSKILGYNSRDCKDLINRKAEFNEEKKSKIDDYLSELILKNKK